MVDQNQPKPPSRKRIRTRVTYTATIDILDETNNAIAKIRHVDSVNSVDQAGFDAALKKVTNLQNEQQEDLDQDYKVEMKRYQEAQRIASMSITERILSWLFSG